MKFKKPSYPTIAVGTLLVIFVAFAAVAVDYEQHQRPLGYNDLTLEQKGEHTRIVKVMAEIERADRQEDQEIYLAFKNYGQIRQKTKLIVFDKEYQSLLKQREALFNPLTRKTEGFGYAVLNFLGFKK